MRKNLFLTLAFAFAAAVGVNAQNWSRTLTTDDGLPGVKTTVSNSERYVYNSGAITPDAPLKTVRITFAETEGGNALNGFPFVNLAELVVYGADGTTPVTYTATSNADQNTMGGSVDGGGLAALNDGIYTNYWHSCWQGSVAEYHYLELTFAEAVSEFSIEWTTRGAAGTNYFHNAPTMVGLTAGGVEFVPFADWNFAVASAPLTSMEELQNAQYFVMKSNVPVEYDTYKNNNDGADGYKFGDKMNKEPNVGPGPKYVKGAEVADAPDASFAIQLLPAGEEGKFYLYYVKEGKFMSKHPSHNGWNGANGTQAGKTGVLSNAAVVTITEENDRFEMHYTMEYNGEEIEIYVGATPSTGGFKIVDEERKKFYDEGNLYCLNYAYVIDFDWSFYAVTMDFPTRYFKSPVKTAVTEAESIYTFMDSVAVEGYEDAYDTFVSTLNETKAKLETANYTSALEAMADVDKLNSASAEYVFSKISYLYETYLPEFASEYEEKLCSANNPIEGYYSDEAFDQYITGNLLTASEALYVLVDEADNKYNYITDMKNFINGVQANIDAFLATQVQYVTLPKVYTAEDPHNTPLGVKNGNHWDWTQQVVLSEKVDGIRLTFLETNVGNASSDGKFQGFPMVAISGLEIVTADGEKLALSTELVTSNSEETHEREAGNGTIDLLFDEDVNTYYHSAWGGAARYDQPYSYIYLDVKFPAGTSLDNFTIKTIGRTNGSLAPGTVCVGKYGEVYDPLLFRPNPYNVQVGAQVTDVAQIKDGGIYVISGNLRVKTQEAQPRFYAGAAPYHTNVKAASNDPCVYMFKKVEGGWNIISLANAQYWALNKEVTETTDEETGETSTSTSWSTGLTVYPEKAGVINIAKSGNLENTFVLFSEIGNNEVTASWTWTNEEDTTDVVKIEEGKVNANKFVYMDWDSYLAGRACVSELPGVFTYGLDAIAAHKKAEDFKNGDGYSAGDYLHFNKANGEGEWNIYEATMDDAYYLWANGIPATLADLGIVVGKDPGCITGDISELEAAVASVEAVLAEENKEGAQAAVEAFAANVGAAETAERVQVTDNYWYAIESAYGEYFKQQNKVKAIYTDGAKLAWGDAPAAYDRENAQYVFQFQKYDAEIDDMGLNLSEEDAPHAFYIYNDQYKVWAGDAGGQSVAVPVTNDDFSAAVYVVKPLSANIYTVHVAGNASNDFHTAGHGAGAGAGGDVVYWNGDAGTASSWYIRFVDDAEGTSVSDLVVEGAEVATVAYFTPAGAAIPAPVKGINIVVTVYTNGVVETKKVLVK